jgi:Tfp pilus assembly protein PilN
MRAVNLIPADQRQGASVGAGRSEGGAYAVLALAVGIALLAFLYGSAKSEMGSRRAQVASLTTQAQSTQAAATVLAPYTSFVALREQRAQAVSTLIGSRFDWAHAFHEFGRTVPPGVSFSSLEGTVGSSTATSVTSTSSSSGAAASTPVASATPPGSVPTFTLSGCATSQQTVARMLERLRLIDGVSEVTLQSSTASSGSGGGGGGCGAHEPQFSATITFDALPTPSAASTSTSAVSDSSGASAGTSGTGSTTSGSVAR